MSRYCFIINPIAGKGSAGKHLSRIKEQINQLKVDYSIELTKGRGNATKLASQAILNNEVVIACGGDGTVNEVSQACVNTSTVMGVMPIGSGNDFFKNISHKKKPNEIIEANQIRKVDVGKIQLQNGTERFFLNSLGIGFTGRIAAYANSYQWLRGDFIYIAALFKVFSDYDSPRMKIDAQTDSGQIQLDEKIYALCIGNGKVEGGKFQITPKAEIDDGLLDICILRDIPRWQILKWVLHFLLGTQIGKKEVVYLKVKSIQVELFRLEKMHLDGEVFDDVTGKLKIEVIPSSLNVIAEKI